MKHIAITLIVFIVSSNLYCQDNVKVRPIEIELGVNHLLSNNKELVSKLGFGVSIKRIWFNDKRINLVSGLLFEKTKYLDDYVQSSHYSHYKDMKYNIYSFSIPLMLRASTGKRYKLFVETGPALEIIPLKWGNGIQVTYPPSSSKTETEISGDFEHDLTDFGANFGIGIGFPINNYRLVLTSTYHSSIQSIIKKEQNELTKYFTVKIGININ